MNKKRWHQLKLIEQMGNIGSEVERTISWRDKGDSQYSRLAFARCLEQVDLTISDPKNIHRLKEITRVREGLIDYFVYNNEYKWTDEFWQKYFFAFAWKSRLQR